MGLLAVIALHAQNASNYIIQNPGNTYRADLQQLESDSVQAYLTLHNLPSTDAPLLYQYGRRDLRDELRSLIFTNLQNVIATPAGSRTVHQQNLYNWFEVLVYKNEVAEYKYAVAEHQKFLANQCAYRLDTTVASAYNLTYKYAPFCFQSLASAFSATPTPGPNYYLAVGLENSYNLGLSTDPQGAVILAETTIYDQKNLAYAILPAAAAAAATGALYATSTLAPFAYAAILDFGSATVIPEVTSALDIGLASAAEAAGPFAIVVAAAAIAIEAGMQLKQEDQDQDALDAQQNYYTSLVANCNSIDMSSFLADSSGVGGFKLLSTFLATTLPDVPSTTTLPGRTLGVDPIWGNAPNGLTFDSIQYTDWNNTQWTASLWGNYILQYQTNNPAVTSFATSIEVTGAAASKYSASRLGSNWLIVPQVAASAAVSCPVNPATGLSAAGSSPTTCTSYVADALAFVSSTNPNVTSWSVMDPPVFQTDGTVTFIDGIAQSIVLSASTDNPIFAGETGRYLLMGQIPQGFSVNSSPSGVMLSYNGVADSRLPGTYNLTANAQFGNRGTSAGPFVASSQALTLTVKPGDSIQVRSNTINAYVGDPVSYTIETNGHPNPVISLEGIQLPRGLMFVQNGATAVIQGTAIAPGTTSGEITTDYGATSPLSISVTYRQSPAITSPNYWMFTNNVPSRFRVLLAPSSSPGPAPAIFASSAPFPTGFVTSVATLANAQQPFVSAPWLQFQAMQNGTALLSGTPPSGTGTLVIYIASAVTNSLPALQTLTISSSSAPAVNGSDLLTATASPGCPAGSVCVTSIPIVNIPINQVTFQSDLLLTIQGDSLFVSNSTYSGIFDIYAYTTAAGTSCPIPGIGGNAAASDFPGRSSPTSLFGAASAAQSSSLIPLHTFHLEIDAPPSIISQSITYFSTGIANSFSVATTGFPEANPVPDSTSTATAMRVTLTGALPSGVTFNDLTPDGVPTGTGIFSGTPTQTGTFPVTIVANNGVGSPAVQAFTLIVNAAGDVNSDGAVDCADIAIVKAAFGSYQGQATYDPRADFNHDFTVNILDLAFVTSHLPAGTRCSK